MHVLDSFYQFYSPCWTVFLFRSIFAAPYSLQHVGEGGPDLNPLLGLHFNQVAPLPPKKLGGSSERIFCGSAVFCFVLRHVGVHEPWRPEVIVSSISGEEKRVIN